jgi:uncharacterized phiE125 gp8 family phage protein
VEPVDGVTYPLVYPNKRNAVTITYICGYGATSASVPESARHAMRLLISDWYNQREDTITGTIVNSLPMGVEALLWQDRIYTF